MIRTTVAVGIAAALGCAHFRTTVDQPVARPDETSVWNFFWTVSPWQAQVNPPCGQGALKQVMVSRTYLDDLLSVVTLGIVSHVQVSWQCTPPPQTCPKDPNNPLSERGVCERRAVAALR